MMKITNAKISKEISKHISRFRVQYSISQHISNIDWSEILINNQNGYIKLMLYIAYI